MRRHAKNDFLLLIFSLFFLTACSVEGEVIREQDEFEESEHFCPRGMTDDPYPGDCHLYVDEDDDGFCDLGQ